jgi:hypothetical protein
MPAVLADIESGYEMSTPSALISFDTGLLDYGSVAFIGKGL